nr:uncharacterized protein LOC126519818 [Dermacentor andersoni]
MVAADTGAPRMSTTEATATPGLPLAASMPTSSRIAVPMVVRLNLSSYEILTASAISSQVLYTPIERSFSVEVLIEIPYALFAPPFFQQGLPRSFNYGGIGTTIAHELGHSLTYSGISRKTTKEYENLIKGSLELFKNKTSCFEKQYKAVNKKLLLELDENYNESTSAEADVYDAFFANSSKYVSITFMLLVLRRPEKNMLSNHIACYLQGT